jgi:trehalose 6-phosphate synthase
MNLVAKEYVAAQDTEDPGVLILSRFAGAAVECEAALLVNPYDPESVGSAIGQALSMPLAEPTFRIRRTKSLTQRLIHRYRRASSERGVCAILGCGEGVMGEIRRLAAMLAADVR